MEKTRKLGRDLSPVGLAFHGLMGGFHVLARQFKEDYGLSVDISEAGHPEPESATITAFLFQAVKELLFNVVKHAGVKEAHVHIRENQELIEIRVADKGGGGAVEQVYARRGVEPGFGLFSIEERVNALGGKVTIQSAPGSGWITTLTIPMNADAVTEKPKSVRHTNNAAASVRAPDQATPLRASREGIRILVVDDHEAMREGLASLLSQQEGFEVIGQAGDGQAAVRMAEACGPDVILMDVSMPELDGIEATERIVGNCPDIAVIGLSMYRHRSEHV